MRESFSAEFCSSFSDGHAKWKEERPAQSAFFGVQGRDSIVRSRDGTVPRTGSNLGTGSQPPEPELNRFRTGSNNLLAEDDSVQNE